MNHFKHKFPSDLKIEIDLLENSNEMRVSFFWIRLNQIENKKAKIFQFKIDDYSKVLETELKPFALNNKILK